MRRACVALVVVCGLAFLAAPSIPLRASGQATPAAICSKVWVGHEAELEEYLKNAEVDRIEAVPIGVTKPKRAFFKPGGPVESAAWKPLKPGIRGGFYESYKAEIAAYELDKLLGLGMVPPYVERRIDGDLGALSLWVENVTAWKISEPVKGTDPAAWNREISRMKLFDRLIGNIDRNQGNLLFDQEFHLILIDHSRALTSSKDMKKITKLSSVDQALWEKIQTLDEPTLTTTLAPWLGKKEIKAILARRDEIKKEIDELVATRGQVIFLR